MTLSIFIAMVTWDAPSTQLQRGSRAWQKWKYELLVTPHFDNAVSGRKPELETIIANIELLLEKISSAARSAKLSTYPPN